MSVKVTPSPDTDEAMGTPAKGISEKVETTPISDVEMGDGGSVFDEQAMLQSDITSASKFMDTVDETVRASCEDPGIFLIIWARRGCSCRADYVVMVMSIIIQTVVPAIIVHKADDPLEEINGKSGFEVKLTAFTLALYLVSTYTGTMNRITAYSYLMSSIPGSGWWVLELGTATLYSSIALTTYATFVLFKGDANVKDILLNCVSLNFLPEADVQLVKLLKISTSSSFGVSASRLNKLAESWTESRARNLVKKIVDMTMTERIKQFPLISCIEIFNQCFVGLMMLMVVAIAIFV